MNKRAAFPRIFFYPFLLLLLILSGCQQFRIGERIQVTEIEQSPDGVEFLILTHEGFKEAVFPLQKRREAEGLSTKIITFGDISSQTGLNPNDPMAIWEYLNIIRSTWKNAPKYILLVGDYVYDEQIAPANKQSRAEFPTFMQDTQAGIAVPSDLHFVIYDENGLPEAAIGRIPAGTPAAIAVVLDKIFAYEERVSRHDNKLLLLVDMSDANFIYDSLLFAELVSTRHDAIIMQIENGDISEEFDLSQAFSGLYDPINYFGHGSLTRWGSNQILVNEDIYHIEATQGFPVLFQWTCLTGYFVHPAGPSLTETLLFAPFSGAVAIFAPSGLSNPTDQAVLFLAMAEAINSLDRSRIGDYILRAQQAAYRQSVDTDEIVETFLLFGDPTMRVNW